MWDCPLAQQIWLRVLRLMSTAEGHIYTWGAVAWSTLTGPALGYELSTDSIILQRHHHGFQRIQLTDPSFLPRGGESDPRWELISSFGLWFIWRAWCRWIFEGRPIPPPETVRDFWVELIHTLRGQYDQIQGNSDEMIQRRHAFLQQWGKGPFCTYSLRTLRWRPLVWLFPPPRAPEIATL